MTRIVAILALCVALAAAFGQRTDYLRLQKMGADDVTVREILLGLHRDE